MNDKELIQIVNQAIPLREKCAMDRANDMARRVWLMKKIKDLVSKELSQQFNASPSPSPGLPLWPGIPIHNNEQT